MQRQNKGMRSTAMWACALALALSIGVPAPQLRLSAQNYADWPVRLRQDIVRLAVVEWRLRYAGSAVCTATASDLGVAIDDRRAYDRGAWPLLERTVGLREFPVVAGVVAGAPASMAGLRVGDELLAIGNVDVETIIRRHKESSLAVDALIAELAAATPAAPLTLKIRRDGKLRDLTVTPVTHCAARLVLDTGKAVDAHSDDRNVAISSGLIAFARNDDEIALAAGHELAHIVLQHRKGGGISARRHMEDDADSLGLRLMHCAGYDPTQGISLFRRLGKGDWLSFLRAPTHRSFAKRVARLEGEIPGLACPVSDATGRRD